MSQSPRRIGRYTILRGLQAGGMAEVFVAKRDGWPEPCVLKRMRVGMGENPVIAQRFIREARVAALLDHPHIAKVFEASVEDGALCMAVELVRGHDLAAIIFDLSRRKVRMPLGLGVAIVVRVLDALHYAHSFTDEEGRSLQIVHRDIGPRNVMIGHDGKVKIIDFGLAKAAFGHVLTQSGVLLGTPRYMAPEQARGETVDVRADVYAVGVTLYELLTGRAVVPDVEPVDALRTVLEVKIPPLSEVVPRAPKGLTPVLERALAKDRKRRPASALEFREDLLRACQKVRIAGEPDIAAFMRQHFPETEDRTSESRMKKATPTPAEGSNAETVVVMGPEAKRIEDTPTVQEIPPAAQHHSIDLAIPPVRVRTSNPNRWRAVAYVLAMVAIVMMGIAAYLIAAGG